MSLSDLPLVIGYCDTTNALVSADPGVFALFGRSAADLIGTRILDATSADDTNPLTDPNAVPFGSESARYGRQLVRPDGSIVRILVTTLILRDAQSPQGMVVVFCHGAAIEPVVTLKAVDVTGRQLRAARAWLGWSVRDLSLASAISTATINRFEDEESIVTVRPTTVDALAEAVGARGIGFAKASDGRLAVLAPKEAPLPGVR